MRVITATTVVTAAAVAVALWAAACNPYDPTLGDRPFRCAAAEPRCPDDYACVERGAGEAFCEVPSAYPDATIDGPPLTCTLDRVEPNQTTGTAFVLGNASIKGLTLCPADDLDFFSFATDTANLKVTVTSDGPTLSLALLTSGGVLIKSGESPPGQRAITELRMLPLAAGDYFLRVSSGSGGGAEQAAYGLDLKMCAGPATCIE